MHSYTSICEILDQRLREPAPGRVQLLTGPRQVGKTHLLRSLEERFAGRVSYCAADTSEAALPGWWELQWREAERRARPDAPAVLLFDEIHALRDWSRRLKTAYDDLVARGVPVHVVVSGSSSLRLGSGARESMAGGFERLELRHWPVSELCRHFDLAEDQAVEIAVRFGTYPGAVPLLDDPQRWRSYVRASIVEPAIGRDIMAMELVRKPALLREVFTVAVNHPAEIVSLQKLRAALSDPGALETIAHYLRLFEAAYLVVPLEKLSEKATRRRAAPPKLVTLNQGIVAAMSGTSSVDTPLAPEVRRRWVENACIAHAWNSGQETRYWRAEPLEVDLVTSGSWGDWAIEVKTGSCSTSDLAGLFELCRRFPRYRPLLLCEEGEEGPATRAGITALPWRRFLLTGPPT